MQCCGRWEGCCLQVVLLCLLYLSVAIQIQIQKISEIQISWVGRSTSEKAAACRLSCSRATERRPVSLPSLASLLSPKLAARSHPRPQISHPLALSLSLSSLSSVLFSLINTFLLLSAPVHPETSVRAQSPDLWAWQFFFRPHISPFLISPLPIVDPWYLSFLHLLPFPFIL